MGYGIYRFAGSDRKWNAFYYRKQICDFDFNEYYFVDRRNLYGSDSGCFDFYTDFPANLSDVRMHPVQFGIMVTLNLCIGTITPPVGSILFTGAKVGNVKIEQVFKELLPYFGVILIVLLLTTYIPAISMTLPTAAGLIQ